MQIYPIITTFELAECKRFYQQALGAEVLFESEWYIHLLVRGFEVGFLKPNPPQDLPVFRHTSLSRGVCFAVEVPDVKEAYKHFQQRGIDTLGKPKQFPGGEIAFSVMDPAGVILNIVERTGGKPIFDPLQL